MASDVTAATKAKDLVTLLIISVTLLSDWDVPEPKLSKHIEQDKQNACALN